MVFGFHDPSKDVAYLGGMFVDGQYRRKGIGRRLVEAVESWARLRGARSLELEVNPETAAAVALYEHCGYQRTGNRRPLTSRRTAIEMAKNLATSG
jgi:GNAT superfamily N-acetyltransferase